MTVQLIAAEISGHSKGTGRCCLQIEPGCIRVRVGDERLIEHCTGEIPIEVEAVAKAGHYDVSRQILAIVREEAVIRQRVHHGAWTSIVVGPSGMPGIG